MSDDPLGRLLADRQLLAADAVERWQRQASAEGVPLDDVLVRGGAFDRASLLRILENHHFCPAVDLNETHFAPALLALLPRRLAARHLALPLAGDGDAVQVAFAEPDNAKTLDAVAFAMRRPVRKAVALRHDLQAAIARFYDRMESATRGAAPPAGAGDPTTPSPEGQPRAATSRLATVGPLTGRPQMAFSDHAPVAIVDRVLDEAILRGASDVHLQPGEHEFLVRLRLDGILQTVAQLPVDLVGPVTSRVKVLGRMDVAERRRPQDGRHTLRVRDGVYDLRISSLPGQFGEKVVVRLLTHGVDLLNLDNLRMPPALRRMYREVVDWPQGLFLVTGPTGSGKTTTLYATLNAIDRQTVNVVTLEDPIEYSLPLITQVQVNEDAGLTFTAGLRSILRQDPDVILVGEIRDVETVEIACRASLTGHKVLSTIHTNDTSQAITRLLNMGTQPYLLAATLRGVLSQRLVRLVCQACREERPPNDTERALLGYRPVESICRGRGCPACGGTGHRGRVAVYEYLRVNDPIQRLILDRASAFTIRHAARQAGMTTLADAAIALVCAGLTTVAEIQRSVLAEENREQLCGRCRRVVSLDYANCPFCQHVLREHCAKCGNPVEATWHACPGCGQEIDRAWQRQHCPQCQAPVEAGWQHCLYCGTPLAEQAGPTGA